MSKMFFKTSGFRAKAAIIAEIFIQPCPKLPPDDSKLDEGVLLSAWERPADIPMILER